MENNKISLRQTGGKSRFRERSTDETTEKNKQKCHTDSDKKAAPKRGIETV